MLSKEEILAAGAVQSVDLTGFGPKTSGKVRDMYNQGDHMVFITTDRVSAFDRVLGTIPCKGQVLNQLSAWWFEQMSDLVGSHLASMPDPNVTVGRRADPLPVEVIVRGYITGVTSTSLWTLYDAGVDRPYGLDLPPGLKKNDKLPQPVITPTTKAPSGEHDERLTSAEVVEQGLVNPKLWEKVQAVALEIFARGQAAAEAAGLILVDTKYEFGLVDGELVLIDEVHTPDSSRYWGADDYAASLVEGRSPRSWSKEHLRKWLAANGYRGEGTSPEIPDDVRVEIARRYIDAYERLTGTEFVPGGEAGGSVNARIQSNMDDWKRGR